MKKRDKPITAKEALKTNESNRKFQINDLSVKLAQWIPTISDKGLILEDRYLDRISVYDCYVDGTYFKKFTYNYYYYNNNNYFVRRLLKYKSEVEELGYKIEEETNYVGLTIPKRHPTKTKLHWTMKLKPVYETECKVIVGTKVIVTIAK